MKHRMNFLTMLIAALAFVVFSNCSGDKKQNTDTSTHEDQDSEHASGSNAGEAGEPQFQVDAKFQEQLANVFTSYVSLKDAFVASDVEKVKVEASKAKVSLAAVDMKLLSGAAHNDWMTYVSPMESSLKTIEANNDIEMQRTQLSTLSDNLYKSIKAFGLGGKEAFYEFCPMAFNNEGGYWLSDQEQIRNPYFGDKMLTCGSVEEKLK